MDVLLSGAIYYLLRKMHHSIYIQGLCYFAEKSKLVKLQFVAIVYF